jgi:YegS/Rv2252/BmrU family lipid kinase
MPDIPRRAVAIINPATRGDVKRITDFLNLSAPRETTIETFVTERASHARELAMQHGQGADLLIAVGGDGTVGEVASAAIAHGVTMGIVPGGSTNIVAKDLGIPTNAHEASRLLFGAHQLRTIDAGVHGEHVFLHMAGAGLDSQLFDLADPAMKRKVGWMAYLPAAFKAFRRPMSRFTVRSEEMLLEGVRSPMVLVANGASVITPQLQLDSRIRYDDGLLDVIVVTATSPVELARVVGSMAMRKAFDSPFVTTFTTRDVLIEAEPDIAVQLDGDVVGKTPVRFTVLPEAITIVVPRR